MLFSRVLSLIAITTTLSEAYIDYDIAKLQNELRILEKHLRVDTTRVNALLEASPSVHNDSHVKPAFHATLTADSLIRTDDFVPFDYVMVDQTEDYTNIFHYFECSAGEVYIFGLAFQIEQPALSVNPWALSVLNVDTNDVIMQIRSSNSTADPATGTHSGVGAYSCGLGHRVVVHMNTTGPAAELVKAGATFMGYRLA